MSHFVFVIIRKDDPALRYDRYDARSQFYKQFINCHIASFSIVSRKESNNNGGFPKIPRKSLFHLLSSNTLPLILSQSLKIAVKKQRAIKHLVYVKNQHATNLLFIVFSVYIIHSFYDYFAECEIGVK